MFSDGGVIAMGLMSITINNKPWAPAKCPKCGAQFMFYGNCTLRIDPHGFEHYDLECPECEERLVGIIDPYDNALLVSRSSF